MEEKNVRLFCVHLDQCDPKKCTALKLKRLGLIQITNRIDKCPRNAIILDPFADKILSVDDKDSIEKYGLIVIDCSWEKTESIFKHKFRTGRKLPSLLAANSVNYGRWERLSSAEAIAASLFLTGFPENAKNILSKYSWGESFIQINKFGDNTADNVENE